MITARSNEGYLLIDHRNSPGVSQEFMRKHNLPGPAVAGGTMLEAAVKNCPHCGGDVIRNPARVRAREHCRKCGENICDKCGLMRKLGHPHRPLRQVMSELYAWFTR